MSRPLFLPSARQAAWLLIVGIISVGYAFYLRYAAIQATDFALACQAGLDTWLCSARKIATAFYHHSVFGSVALGAAALNLLRPSIVLITVSLMAAGMGVVLNNATLSALAVGLLLLSLARPAPVPE